MGMVDPDGVPVYYDYDPAKLAAIRSRPDARSDTFGATASFPFGSGFEAKLKIRYSTWKNYGNVAGASARSLMFSAGVRWKL